MHTCPLTSFSKVVDVFMSCFYFSFNTRAHEQSGAVRISDPHSQSGLPALLPCSKWQQVALLIITQCSTQIASHSTQIAPTHSKEEKKIRMYFTFSICYFDRNGTPVQYDLSVSFLKYFRNSIFEIALNFWLCWVTQMHSGSGWACFRIVVWVVLELYWRRI